MVSFQPRFFPPLLFPRALGRISLVSGNQEEEPVTGQGLKEDKSGFCGDIFKCKLKQEKNQVRETMLPAKE